MNFHAGYSAELAFLIRGFKSKRSSKATQMMESKWANIGILNLEPSTHGRTCRRHYLQTWTPKTIPELVTSCEALMNVLTLDPHHQTALTAVPQGHSAPWTRASALLRDLTTHQSSPIPGPQLRPGAYGS